MAKVNTKYGEMDEKDLSKIEHLNGVVEYYLGKELVHRSASVALTGIEARAEQAKF